MNDDGEIEALKQTVLKEYPRLAENDSFSFNCHPGLKCFNQCCGDVTIVLSPYDILRMKKALRLSSEEFLKRYTFVPFSQGFALPIPILRMDEGEGKRCPFVGKNGCTIYADRPWACRMYPLGMASPKNPAEQGEPFYFLIRERPCDGFDEDRSLTIREWLKDQCLIEYNAMGEDFKEITLHDFFIRGKTLDPKKMEMLYMACYDLDRFRRFLFESTFFENFNVAADEIERIQADELELMRFAFRWLKFCLFGEPTIMMKDKVSTKTRERNYPE